MFIFFDTATYDEIERDEKVAKMTMILHIVGNSKVTMEAQLGLIGGTMGLLTGFSILSGVEIIYHLLRYLVLDFFIPLTLSSGSSCLLRSPELKWSLLSTQDLKII